MSNRHGCEGRQQSDQMRCERCNLVWDMNDLDEPECVPVGAKPSTYCPQCAANVSPAAFNHDADSCYQCLGKTWHGARREALDTIKRLLTARN